MAESGSKNYRMLWVFTWFGFVVHRETDHGTVHVACSLMPDEDGHRGGPARSDVLTRLTVGEMRMKRDTPR